MEMRNTKIMGLMMMVVLAGCSSDKEVSKSNFTKVIDRYFADSCILIAPRNTNFPVTVQLEADDTGASADNKPQTVTRQERIAQRNTELTRQYEALVDIGLLEVESGSAEVVPLFSRTAVRVPTKVYTLTPQGEKALVTGPKNFLGGRSQGFCAGHYRVDDIVSFSEPSQAMGYTISQVTYHFSPNAVMDWVTKDTIAAAFPRLSKQLEKHQQDKVALILMNDGWVHEKAVR